MRKKILLLLASPTSKGKMMAISRPAFSSFQLRSGIAGGWEGLLCPSYLVCAIMGEAPMNLASLWILQVFALEIDVGEVH